MFVTMLYGKKYYHDKKIEDGYEVSNLELKLGQWDKHFDLHDYIMDNFADDFCQVWLDADDMRQILEALPDMGGTIDDADDAATQQAYDIATFKTAIEWLEIPDISPFDSRSVRYEVIIY